PAQRMKAVADIAGITSAEQFLQDVVLPCRPAVLRGLVKSWPVVQAAQSASAFRNYINRFDAGGEMDAFFGAPHIAGKYYYADDMQGFNFERRKMRLAAALDIILTVPDRPDAPSVYAGSLPVTDYLPGFTAE